MWLLSNWRKPQTNYGRKMYKDTNEAIILENEQGCFQLITFKTDSKWQTSQKLPFFFKMHCQWHSSFNTDNKQHWDTWDLLQVLDHLQVADLDFSWAHQPNFKWLILHSLRLIWQAASHIYKILNKLSQKTLAFCRL